MNDDNNKQSEKVQVEKICFSYGFRPIYYFSRVIGLMPYSMVYNLNGEIQDHRIYIRDGLWLVTSISLYISVILHVFRDMKLPQDPNSTLYIFILGNNIENIKNISVENKNKFPILNLSIKFDYFITLRDKNFQNDDRIT